MVFFVRFSRRETAKSGDAKKRDLAAESDLPAAHLVPREDGRACELAACESPAKGVVDLPR